MKLNLEPFWTQWDHTLPHLTLWTKEGMWCDWCVWLHSAEIQKRHQDCNRHLQEQKSEEIWLDTTVMWCIKKKPLKGFNNLQETLWERSAASGQLFVFACCFLHNPCRTAGWERSGKVQWRMQSWAAGTDFCVPERQNTNVVLIDASWKMTQLEAHSYSLALDRRSHLPVLIQLEEGLVLSGAQHQEVDEQEHA